MSLFGTNDPATTITIGESKVLNHAYCISLFVGCFHTCTADFVATHFN